MVYRAYCSAGWVWQLVLIIVILQETSLLIIVVDNKIISL